MKKINWISVGIGIMAILLIIFMIDLFLSGGFFE